MKSIFIVPKEMGSTKDEVLKFLDKISARDFNFPSGMVFVQLGGIGDDYTAVRMQLQQGKESWGLLTELVESMHQELGKLIRLFEGFYQKKSVYAEYDKDGLSPMEINFLIKSTMVRIKRMLCVLSPDFNTIKFQDKKTPNRYTMIKGYWVDDYGTRKRSFSKNVGNTESSMVELIHKMIKSNFKVAVVSEPDLSSNFRPDLIVFDGKQRWAIDTKLQTMENLIKTFVMLEMWKLYQKTYELIV